MLIAIYWQGTSDMTDYNILKSEDIVPINPELYSTAAEIFTRTVTQQTRILGLTTGAKS